MSTEVRVPTLGESVTEAVVATWFKKPGDAIAADEMLCELETDKVTVEVPAPAGGVLGEIVAAEGETVGVDALLATIAEEGAETRTETGAETGAEEGEAPAEASDGNGAEAGGVAAAPGKEEVQAERGGDGELAPREPSATEKERAGYAEEIRAKRDEKAGAEEEGAAEEAPSGGSSSGGGERVEVTVPALGESVTEAVVASWFKKVGDAVEADEPLCELETDKVSVEVPAPSAGTLTEILAEEGATVEASATIAVLTQGAAGAPAKAPEKAPAGKAPSSEGTAGPEADATGGEPDHPRADYGRSDEAEAPKAGDGAGRGPLRRGGRALGQGADGRARGRARGR